MISFKTQIWATKEEARNHAEKYVLESAHLLCELDRLVCRSSQSGRGEDLASGDPGDGARQFYQAVTGPYKDDLAVLDIELCRGLFFNSTKSDGAASCNTLDPPVLVLV